MSSRFYLSIGLTIAAVAVGGWRMLLPFGSTGQAQVGQSMSGLLGTISSAEFTGAEATLDAQHEALQTYAGAPVTAPVTLVRADATSYCIQAGQGTAEVHIAGPGGTPAAGPC
jgi:hypothetical protein